MRGVLISNRRNRDRNMVFVFGPERVILCLQLLRKVTVLPLMVLNLVRVEEVKRRRRRTVLVHIASRRSMVELFTITG